MSDDVKPLTREKIEEYATAFEEMGYAVHVTGKFLREWVATARAGLEDRERLDWLEHETMTSEVGVNLYHFLHAETDEPAGLGVFCYSVPDQTDKTLRGALDKSRTAIKSTIRSGLHNGDPK